ncbi:MAG: DUF3592 domain-containing protein [Desulfobacteraceae bacterium]|nr:DUF3592 domain-containing protein [Desulfobacteraceae bacterium]
MENVDKKKKNKPIVPKLLLLCLFTWFIKVSIAAFWFGIMSTTWPSTEGIVLEKSLAGRQVEGRTLHKPEIKYKYWVNNNKYNGDKISFSIFTFGKDWAITIINKYNPNDKIRIFYNPQNPQLSCIKPGPEIWATFYTLLSFGGIFYILFSFYRNKKN